MIYHVVPLTAWRERPGSPYAPASLETDGYVHCSPDEATTLAVVNAFYRSAPRPLLALVLDEERLSAGVRFEAAEPAPLPGAPEGVLFPHVHGPVEREAVVRLLEVRWDDAGRATGLAEFVPSPPPSAP
ncbi:DUF952 domain-containing protein [Streptomyces sp. NPDC005805]|uniref:DUF952 domain-containing protein n=1 Tax=Streptomyces sp. NPDC005805 TaxID=3157068 RepID=UPI0033E15D92